jgi:hypothetical protein
MRMPKAAEVKVFEILATRRTVSGDISTPFSTSSHNTTQHNNNNNINININMTNNKNEKPKQNYLRKQIYCSEFNFECAMKKNFRNDGPEYPNPSSHTSFPS